MHEDGSAIPIALTSCGIAGIAGVSFHVLLTHNPVVAGRGLLFEALLPAAGGVLLGLLAGAIMNALGRIARPVPEQVCGACGAGMHAAWRVCPECGSVAEPAE